MIFDDQVNRVVACGFSLFCSGIGIKWGISGIKVLITSILPMFRGSTCPSHNELLIVLTRVDTRVEDLIKNFEQYHKEEISLRDELFNRMRVAETKIEVLEDREKR